MRKYLYIVGLLLALTGCKEKVDMDLDMYNSEQISLMVKGKKVFTYTEGLIFVQKNQSRKALSFIR